MIGTNALFAFYCRPPTCTTPTMVIAYLDQGGLTLPDRDYYLKDDAKHERSASTWSSMRPRC